VRVGLFGGSFDPIHAGHVAAARAARRELALDRVLFLPTAQPPHKPERRFAPDLQRYAMVELALLDEPDFRVSAVELTPGRPAYAIETWERFRAEAPGDEHVLLIGADSLAGFDGWRRWRELLATVEIGVFARPGFDWGALEPRLEPELARAVAAASAPSEGRPARLRWLPTAHPASASEIRRRLADCESLPEGWLDSRVLTFVTKHALYR
jgi:nicotinate-nucleotide adenylyltransferase